MGKKSKKEKHKKKKSKRQSSSSEESDSSGSPDVDKRLKDWQLKRLKEKDARKQEEELLKSIETPEEKRARRMAKKESKERKRKARMGWDEEYLKYTNDDNPFGDENLLNSFVWKKKNEREGVHEIEAEAALPRKQEEAKNELEKVKRRRLEREKERDERDKERELMQRDKECEYYSAWEKQEDAFHLQQALMRSQIRIEEGRAKPIDLLAKYISSEEDQTAIEMHEPYSYLNRLTMRDLEDLIEDIKVYQQMDVRNNTEFWRDMTIVTEDELNKLRKLDMVENVGERREGINQSVVDDVASVFKGKSHGQLVALEKQIREKLKGGEGIDVGYWESLLLQLQAHMARARLRDRHQAMLRSKLEKLKAAQGIEIEPSTPSTSRMAAATAPVPTPAPAGEEEMEATADEDLPEVSFEDYDESGYSPRLLEPSELPPDAILVDPVEDMTKLEYKRHQVRGTGAMKPEMEDIFEKKARENMGTDEAAFNVEVPVEQHYLWSDKYRPRKPRFFNRVHTGFEWNQYNKKHYDMDNPPPKTVQGYKFNIFYPDIIDKTKSPSYTIRVCYDNPDFANLRFHAGPPYEDIAFKIVHREWDLSYRHGFRCQFQNGIFQLWFHFRKWKYRR